MLQDRKLGHMYPVDVRAPVAGDPVPEMAGLPRLGDPAGSAGRWKLARRGQAQRFEGVGPLGAVDMGPLVLASRWAPQRGRRPASEAQRGPATVLVVNAAGAADDLGSLTGVEDAVRGGPGDRTPVRAWRRTPFHLGLLLRGTAVRARRALGPHSPVITSGATDRSQTGSRIRSTQRVCQSAACLGRSARGGRPGCWP